MSPASVVVGPGLQVGQAEHGPDADARPHELHHVLLPALGTPGLEQVLPDVGGDVDEVACHEHHDVVLGYVVDVDHGQPDNYADHRHEVDEPVAQHCLGLGEVGLEQHCHVAQLPRDLVGDDSHDHGDDLSPVARREGHPQGQPVNEVVDQGPNQIHVAGRALAPQVAQAALLFLFGTGFVLLQQLWVLNEIVGGVPQFFLLHLDDSSSFDLIKSILPHMGVLGVHFILILMTMALALLVDPVRMRNAE